MRQTDHGISGTSAVRSAALIIFGVLLGTAEAAPAITRERSLLPHSLKRGQRHALPSLRGLAPTNITLLDDDNDDGDPYGFDSLFSETHIEQILEEAKSITDKLDKALAPKKEEEEAKTAFGLEGGTWKKYGKACSRRKYRAKHGNKQE